MTSREIRIDRTAQTMVVSEYFSDKDFIIKVMLELFNKAVSDDTDHIILTVEACA